MKKGPSYKDAYDSFDQYTDKRINSALLVVVVGVVLSFLLLFYFTLFCDDTEAKDFYTTNEIWDEVQLIGNYAEDHPVFSDTTNVQATLIKDAYGWLQGVVDGYSYLDKFSLTDTVGGIQYDLVSTGWADDLISPVKIYAVRRKDTGNPQSLFSTSVDDLNKVFDLQISYPEFYAFDGSHIYFNSSPAADTVFYVWAFRQGSTDSACVWGRIPPLLSIFRHVLVFRTIAQAKAKEGNEVAERNIKRVCQSMVSRILNTHQMIEQAKDIKVLPQIYQEE